jgi:hypothetical protein
MNWWTRWFILRLRPHLRPTACIDVAFHQRAPNYRGFSIHTGLNYSHWYMWFLGQVDLGRRRHIYVRKNPDFPWCITRVVFHGPKALTYNQHRLTWRGWVDITPSYCKVPKYRRELIA